MEQKKTLIWEPHTYSFIENEHIFKKNEELDDDGGDLKYEEDYDKNGGFDPDDIGRLIQTPWGLFNVDDEMNPYRQFRFYIGHYSENLTADIVSKIEEVPGIEVLHVLTRYRFMIACGKAFNAQQVRLDINNLLCNNDSIMILNDQDIDQIIKEVSKHKKWSVYIFPNGGYDAIFLQDDNSNLAEYEEMYKIHENSFKLSKGKWLKSESE